MLKAITAYAKDADFGIEDVQFDFDSKEVSDLSELPDDLPTGMKTAYDICLYWILAHAAL